MKLRTISLALAAAAILFLGMAGTGLAFHDGGVASCNGCHTMHNSLGNVSTWAQGTQFTAGAMLLKGTDQSSACLSCHGAGPDRSGYHSYSALADFTTGVPQQHTPAGDFAWLKVGTMTARDLRGHNIIAADFGLVADGRTGMATSPGGSYPNSKFFCTSCHDPHGKYRVDVNGNVATSGLPIGDSGSYGDAPTAEYAVGAYRLLAGKSYKPKSLAAGDPAFDAAIDPPIAVSSSSYNITIGDNTVAYGSGMSEWCKNCHSAIHNDSVTSPTRHPSGNNAKLTTDVVANYNAYVKTGDMSGTGGAAAYNTLVPFEHGLGYSDRATLLGYTTTPDGASTAKNVACMSCHRIHASGFQSMLRWNNTMMVAGGVYANPTGLSATQTPGAYYDRPTSQFATEQRSLCNKCHAKD